jgi:ribonuclease BN (tRNA processing enzyme)
MLGRIENQIRRIIQKVFDIPTLRAACDDSDPERKAAITKVSQLTFEMAVAAGAKALALTHLARFTNADNLRAEAQEIFPGPVTVPDDCMTLRV